MTLTVAEFLKRICKKVCFAYFSADKTETELDRKNNRTVLKATFFYGVRKSRAFFSREEKGAIFKLRKKAWL